jgi:hypothetical protein
VPEHLKGKKLDEIRAWARGQLNGQEPDLKARTLAAIRGGTLHSVVLQPRKPGFFLPDGTFVEAFGSTVSIGTDLDKAEEEWDQEDADREWVDKETERFNKSNAGESAPEVTRVRLHWEHGKRIADYVQLSGRPLFRIQTLLAERRGRNGYSLRGHQYASHLYEWRPNPAPNDPIFTWTWQLVDALLGFTSNRRIRDYCATLVVNHLRPARASIGAISRFFRGPTESEDPPWIRDRVFLTDAYERLRRGEVLDDNAISRLVLQFA